MARNNHIGALDQRVTFQKEQTTSDGQGGFTLDGWADIDTVPTVWAEVSLSHGSESGEGERRSSNFYSIDVRVRNREDITELMAVVWRGRRYNIRSIIPFDKRREFLIVQAEGGVAV